MLISDKKTQDPTVLFFLFRNRGEHLLIIPFLIADVKESQAVLIIMQELLTLALELTNISMSHIPVQVTKRIKGIILNKYYGSFTFKMEIAKKRIYQQEMTLSMRAFKVLFQPLT